MPSIHNYLSLRSLCSLRLNQLPNLGSTCRPYGAGRFGRHSRVKSEGRRRGKPEGAHSRVPGTESRLQPVWRAPPPCPLACQSWPSPAKAGTPYQELANAPGAWVGFQLFSVSLAGVRRGCSTIRCKSVSICVHLWLNCSFQVQPLPPCRIYGLPPFSFPGSASTY